MRVFLIKQRTSAPLARLCYAKGRSGAGGPFAAKPRRFTLIRLHVTTPPFPSSFLPSLFPRTAQPKNQKPHPTFLRHSPFYTHSHHHKVHTSSPSARQHIHTSISTPLPPPTTTTTTTPLHHHDTHTHHLHPPREPHLRQPTPPSLRPS